MGSYYFLTVTNIYFYSVLTLCQTLCYLLYELSHLIFKITLQYGIMFILPIVTEIRWFASTARKCFHPSFSHFKLTETCEIASSFPFLQTKKHRGKVTLLGPKKNLRFLIIICFKRPNNCSPSYVTLLLCISKVIRSNCIIQIIFFSILNDNLRCAKIIKSLYFEDWQ